METLKYVGKEDKSYACISIDGRVYKDGDLIDPKLKSYLNNDWKLKKEDKQSE